MFAVLDCGFVPRSALEKSESGETRIEKLYRIIGQCRYGIHDISATELDSANHLPRFNMPLELGIFLGATKFGSKKHRSKSFLVLDRERYRYQRFCSDLGGHDPKAHDGKQENAIRSVRNWLTSERPEPSVPGGRAIWNRFGKFTSDLPVICDAKQVEPDALEFHDLTTVIEIWLLDNPR